MGLVDDLLPTESMKGSVLKAVDILDVTDVTNELNIHGQFDKAEEDKYKQST